MCEQFGFVIHRHSWCCLPCPCTVFKLWCDRNGGEGSGQWKQGEAGRERENGRYRRSKRGWWWWKEAERGRRTTGQGWEIEDWEHERRSRRRNMKKTVRERHVAGARCGYVTLPPAYCWWQRKARSNSSEWRGGGWQQQHLRGRGSRSIHQRHIKGQTCFYLPVISRIQPATDDRCCSPDRRSLEQHPGCSLNRVV